MKRMTWETWKEEEKEELENQEERLEVGKWISLMHMKL